MRTPLCDMLGVEFPIMAFSHCRDVVVAVSKAGGFGVLGATAFTPEQLEIELDWIDTVIEFPGVIFREWRAISDKCYVRSNDSTVSYRECQVTAEEEALHG